MIAYWKFGEWPNNWLHDDTLWYQFNKFHTRFNITNV